MGPRSIVDCVAEACETSCARFYFQLTTFFKQSRDALYKGFGLLQCFLPNQGPVTNTLPQPEQFSRHILEFGAHLTRTAKAAFCL